MREAILAVRTRRQGGMSIYSCDECGQTIHDQPRAFGTGAGEYVLCRECAEKFEARRLRQKPGLPKQDDKTRKWKDLE